MKKMITEKNKAFIAVAELLNWNKNIAPILEAQVPPEPGTEQLTAPWIRKQIGGFFRFMLETASCRTEVQMPFSAFTKDEHLWLH